MKAKTKITTLAAATFFAAGIIFLTACQKDSSTVTPANTQAVTDLARQDRSVIFPIQANMYGKTYPEWVAEFWKWNLQFDCDHVPLRDVDGSRESQNQSGPVFFLSGRRGNTLSVTVPADKSIFIPLITFEADFPCSDNGDPAPGETIEHFLTSIASTNADAMDQLLFTIDGVPVNNLSDYKIISPMFSIAANSDLANCFDNCITGTAQQFVASGYFLMLKPLSPGQHVIRRVGGASAFFPFVYDNTYNITQL